MGNVVRGVLRSPLRTPVSAVVGLPDPVCWIPFQSTDQLFRGAGSVTTTRATIGTYIDKDDGLLKTAAIDAPRFETKGRLIEGPTINTALRTEQLDNAFWVKAGVNASGNATTAPDNTVTAEKLVETATDAIHLLGSSSESITSGLAYTFSSFSKADERSVIQVAPSSGAFDGTSFANYDLSLGVLGSSNTGTAQITNAANGFFRHGYTVTATATTSTSALNLLLQTSTTAPRVATYLGDGSSGLFSWGVQIEQLAFPSSYVQTISTALPRALDDINIESGNIPVPTADYSVCMTADILGLDSTKAQTLYSVDGETTRKIVVNTTTGLIEATHGAVTSTSTTAMTAGTPMDICFVVDGTNQTLYINGIQEDQDVKGTVTGTATGISIGNAAGSDQLYGHIKPFKTYNVALSASQVASL